ncbi:hypothetical protein [Flavobacterium laiguense]|uniref:Uncharacterized protein n=1 Tax=Flavobacterium laiguense TaxID=2169409 RepID=A0A2U1JW44_9FLAO|nr:hypothetical protein [Flavobacterium laiguense]PWA09164.1 hypothetical protein DB891_09500 [Flavobacterium laiguense]
MSKNVEIKLIVDASSLYAMKDPTQKEVENACKLEDNNNGNSPNGTIDDFTSQVYLDKEVKWKGKTKDNGYSIAIDCITYEPKTKDPNDEDFFDETVINGSGGKNGEVNAKVKNNKKLIGKIDVYSINFSSHNHDSSSYSFHIDPKLLGNS